MVIKIWAASRQNQQNECAPSEDSDQPGHPPSLIRGFAVRTKKAWVLSYPLSAQRKLSLRWADAQADLSLRWAHSHFVGFVMSRLIYIYIYICKSYYISPSMKFCMWANLPRHVGQLIPMRGKLAHIYRPYKCCNFVKIMGVYMFFLAETWTERMKFNSHIKLRTMKSKNCHGI